MTQLAQLSHFPLAKAFYCQDCKSVGNSGSICPACGCAGSNLMALAPILDRQEANILTLTPTGIGNICKVVE